MIHHRFEDFSSVRKFERAILFARVIPAIDGFLALPLMTSSLVQLFLTPPDFQLARLLGWLHAV